MNRFKIDKSGIEKVMDKLKNPDKSIKLPGFYTKSKDKEKFEIKNGNLFFENKEIIAKEKVETVLRDAFYDKKSKVPWSRDAGYSDLAKRYIGISKRDFAEFARKQRVKIRTDNVSRKVTRAGRKLSKKGTIEIDLFQISRKDLPTYIKKTFKPTLEKNTQHFVLHMTDKLTSLSFLSYLGHGAKTKSRDKVMPKVREGSTFFSTHLGIPKSKLRYLRDAGGEFDPNLKGHIIKLGPAIESRNSFAQRVLHRLLAAKRGDLKSVIKQTQDIMNNTKSRNIKKTPLEAAGSEAADLAPLYNKTRAVGKPTPEKALKVGDMVRVVTKDKKNALYKAYKATQFSSKKYKILEVSKSKPRRYKINYDGQTSGGKIKKTMIGKRWFYRDQISNAEEPIDQVSENRLSKLTATGQVKAQPKPKPKKKAANKKPPPPASPIKPRRSRRGVKRVDYSGMM